MREYIVYRHGPGDADRTAVLRVRARSPEEACCLAAQQVPVAGNQILSAELADEVDAKIQDLDRKVEALEREEEVSQ
jgi:hypothetical protein